VFSSTVNWTTRQVMYNSVRLSDRQTASVHSSLLPPYESSVVLPISKTTWPNFSNFCACMLDCGGVAVLGSVVAPCCDTYGLLPVADDVIYLLTKWYYGASCNSAV